MAHAFSHPQPHCLEQCEMTEDGHKVSESGQIDSKHEFFVKGTIKAILVSVINERE
jgi:hypothetical protein